MPAKHAAALTRAQQLRAFNQTLSTALVDEFSYGIGLQSLRPVHAALETLHALPAHHRDTPEADSPDAPTAWLWNWVRARQAERAAQTAAAMSRYHATKAA